MSDRDALIRSLAADLAPVRGLWPPVARAACYLAAVLVLGLVIASFSDLAMMRHRFLTVPDMWLAALGALATGVLAAFAAFELSLPDRAAGWAWLPLPGLVLWLGASGVGCIGRWGETAAGSGWAFDADGCVGFLIGLSVPLSVLLLWMLRRGFSVRPGLTALMAGLASAGLVAALLNLFHPFDAASLDIAVHGSAVGLVVLANRLLAGRLLAGRPSRVRRGFD
jgi:hypothetical protein